MSAHDHTIRVQVCRDDVFRFVTTDGNGKVTHSGLYHTDDTDGMYEMEVMYDERWWTREECTAIRKDVRKKLKATVFA